MNIKISGDFVYIIDPSPSEKVTLSGLHNAVYSKVSGYRIPCNLWSLRELIRSFPRMKDNADIVQVGKTLRAEFDYLLSKRDIQPRVDMEDRLRMYQRKDVSYLAKIPSGGIFNEPRTGKTPTTIELMKALDTSKNLIVSPASLIYNWEKEVKEWYPDIPVYVISGKPKERKKLYQDLGSKKRYVLIISKDTLKLDSEEKILKQAFDFMAVDEAHFLRNYKTTQSNAICRVKSLRRFALTGTPTVKHPADIYGILKFLYPSKFPSYWQFVERYFGIQQGYGGRMEEAPKVKPHRQEELQQMIGMISTSRKRKEVMSWLPDKQRMNIPLKMDEKQERHYKNMLKYFESIDLDTQAIVDAEGILTQLLRLRQLCLDPRLVGFDIEGVKTKALKEWLDDNREPVVIMSMFTSYLKLLKPELEKMGLRVGMIHGEMSNAEKSDSAVSFQKGQYDVLLCNIISAGTGFTLDRSEQVIFTDKAWNPADNQQAEDRITPVSQERNHSMTIISFEVQSSVDSKINRLLNEKKSLTDIINEGGAEAIRRLLK